MKKLIKPYPTIPETSHLKEDLTEEQMHDLHEVLEEFDTLFGKGPSDLGRTDVAEHVIEIEPGSKPPRDQVRRLTPDKRAFVDEQIRILTGWG